MIGIKSDYLLQAANHDAKCYEFNPSNSILIQYAKGKIKGTRRTLRPANKSIKNIKTRKSIPNKIDRGQEIPNNDKDCDRIDAEEGKED